MKRISPLKRRAIVLLFLDGSDRKVIARLFGLSQADVDQVLRLNLRGRR
jgi:DNA-directed RNA polymerase specialized sigma24 family protein